MSEVTETVSAVPRPSSGGHFRNGLLCVQRNVVRLRRSPTTLVQSLAFPGLLLIVLSITFGRVIAGSVEQYSLRLVPQLVVAAGAFGAAGTGLAVLADRQSGMIDRFRSLPIPRSAFLTGTIGADAIRAFGSCVLMVAIGMALGFRFSGGLAGAVGFFALAVVFGTVWAWAATALGLSAQSAESVNSMLNGPVLMLFFLSTGFVPVEGFPALLQPLVRANPLSCAVNALMGLSQGGATLVPVVQTLAWTVLLTGLFAWLSVLRLRASH